MAAHWTDVFRTLYLDSFYAAVENQPVWPLLQHKFVKYAGVGLGLYGAVLVACSSYKLGWKNTFMGECLWSTGR